MMCYLFLLYFLSANTVLLQKLRVIGSTNIYNSASGTKMVKCGKVPVAKGNV